MKAEFYDATVPPGWLKCNGAEVSRAVYARLYAKIGTRYGAGNGSTTFNLPDDRGNFSRAWDDGRGVDPTRGFGTEQPDAFRGHSHSASSAAGGGHTHSASSATAGSHGHTAATSSAGEHSHAGTTAVAGSHSHGFDIHEPDDGMGSRVAADGGGDDSRPFVTASAGEHSHGFTTDTEAAHSHTVNVTANGAHTHTITLEAIAAHSHAITVGTTGGAETRPRNRATLWCIKY